MGIILNVTSVVVLSLVILYLLSKNKELGKKLIRVENEKNEFITKSRKEIDSIKKNMLQQVEMLKAAFGGQSNHGMDKLYNDLGKKTRKKKLVKVKPTYNVDNILAEISKNGMSKISKSKLDFLNKQQQDDEK